MDWRIPFYFAVQLVGSSLLIIWFLASFASSKLARNPVLKSLCLSWVFSSFPCLCLLLFARQVTGPPPDDGICLASATLTMAQTPLICCSAFALVLHIWMNLRSMYTTNDYHWRMITVLLVTLPWFVFICFAAVVLYLGHLQPDIVQRSLYYCVVNNHTLMTVISAFSASVLLCTCVLNVWIFFIIRRSRSLLAERGVDMGLYIRVLIFGAYILLGLGLSFIALVDWTSPIPDLFFSTCPLAVFIVFASQRDMWRSVGHRGTAAWGRVTATGLTSDPVSAGIPITPLQAEFDLAHARTASRSSSIYYLQASHDGVSRPMSHVYGEEAEFERLPWRPDQSNTKANTKDAPCAV